MNRLIIHVDDRESYRETFRGLVEPKGFRLRGYADSASASTELLTSEPFIAVVDSIGFEFAKRLKKVCQHCRIVVLSTQPPPIAEFADVIISKGSKDWLSKVLDYAEAFTYELQITKSGSIDLFSDGQRANALCGKIVVLCMDSVGGKEQEACSFDTLNEAIAWLKHSDKTMRYRIVQGPTTTALSLYQLENSALD